MIISNLNYLEVVAEASGISGGRSRYADKYAVDTDVKTAIKAKPIVNVRQGNVSVINQVAVAVAVAVSIGGKAVADAQAGNNAELAQLN